MPTDDDFTTQLIERNRHLNALLQNTVETLEKERHLNAATKNRVPGGYYMMSRAAEKNLRSLQRENPGAALVFSVLREHMQIGTNAVTISNPALAKILGKSPRTIARATKHLVDHAFVQVIKTGNTNKIKLVKIYLRRPFKQMQGSRLYDQLKVFTNLFLSWVMLG